jgi:Sulfotransferase domain
VHVLRYEELVRDPADVVRRVFEFLELDPIPLSEPVEPGANERYFRRWQELKRSDPRMRAYLDLVSLWYERRFRRYGYSLLFPGRST